MKQLHNLIAYPAKKFNAINTCTFHPESRVSVGQLHLTAQLLRGKPTRATCKNHCKYAAGV